MASNDPVVLRQIQPIEELSLLIPPSYTIDDLYKTPTERAFSEPTPSADNAFTKALGASAVSSGFLLNAIPSARVLSLPDGTTITPDVNAGDLMYHKNTQAIGTLTVNKPFGNPQDGQKVVLKILSSAVQTFSWNPIYRGSTTLTLPSATTGGGDYDYIGFIFNEIDNAYDLLAVIKGV